ncbi:MAG: hypothetical protein IJV66_02750 [Firmicutes bacterium]|nr:hypothetical protein [Bacillota bacterium]
MRGLYRNRRKIWYANYVEKEEILEDGKHTGLYRYAYTKPVAVYVNKSTTSGLTNNNISGKVRRYMYGEEKDYNVTINPIPATCDISESSVLWVDAEPVIEEDGSTLTPYDHVITRISYALNWRALQAVKVDRAGETKDETFDR